LLNVSDMTSTFKLVALVLLCAMGLACIEGDYPDSGAPVLAGQTVEAERFLGSWRQVAGEYGRLCEGATLSTEMCLPTGSPSTRATFPMK
jgi:hypothetical protein